MAEDSFIKMQFPEAPGKGNNFSRFDGKTFIFGPDVRVDRIVQIRVAKSQVQARTWEKTINPGTPLLLNEFSDNGNVITLVNRATKIKVIYVERPETQAEFEARATPQQVKAQQELICNLTNQFNGTIETSKLQNIIGNFSSLNTVGQTSGGFKCLTNSAKPTKDFTKRPMIGELIQGAVDGSADVTSTKTTELTTLFKSPTITSSAILTKKIFDQPSANAILNLYKVHTTASSDVIKSTTKQILPTNLSIKVIEQATAAIDDADAGITLDSKVIKDTKAEIKSKQIEVQEAGLSFNPLGMIPQGGRSVSNIFGSVVAKVKSIVTETGGKIPVTIPNVPDGASPPPNSLNLPNILSGFDSLTGKINFNTNVNKFVSKGGLTPDKGYSTAINLSKSNSSFNGYSTPSTYKFEFLESVDEIKSEFENSSRIKAENENNAILALIIGWTNQFYGPPEKVNATEIQKITKLSDQQTQIRIKGNLKAVITHLTNKAVTKVYGIQPHYIILTDGRIQKGRPIDEIRNSETCLFELTGIEVTIVANAENPPNQKQSESLNILLKHAYSALPGINVFGEDEIKDGNTGPGLDMQALRDKFGKSNTIDNPENGGIGLNRKKIAYIVPKDIAKTTTSASTLSQTLSTDKLLTKFERINPETGKVEPINFEESEKIINADIEEISINKKGITEEIDAAFTKVKGSSLKIKGDSKITELQSGLNKSISQVDKTLKDFKVANVKDAIAKLKNVKFRS